MTDKSDKSDKSIKEPALIVALDYDCGQQALQLAKKLSANNCAVKVGLQLFTAEGPSIVEKLHKLGFLVFLDLKFHDIPNTAAQAIRMAADLGVWMVNVHAAGGETMLCACRDMLENYQNPPYLLAVTVLTSLLAQDLHQVGVLNSPQQQVERLVKLSKSCGMDGVVCSAHEVAMLRQQIPQDFLLVTPGLRLPNDACDDQQRVMTPWQAYQQGSNFLVVGRSITGAADPNQVVDTIIAQL